MIKFLTIIAIIGMVSCTKDDMKSNPLDQAMYFPATTDTIWSRFTFEDLGWDRNDLVDLRQYLMQTHTKSFMILVNGKIVMEDYYNGHHQNDTWPWNSAGKTLVSAITGIAQEQGLLNINHKGSTYLGEGWTSAPIDKENLITIRHLLTMTSGLSDEKELVTKANLTYVADAGQRWAYHNVFQKLTDVIGAASGMEFQNYFFENLMQKIGMTGSWNFGLIFRIFHSDTRSMARFGLLALNHGQWQDKQIIPKNYFDEAIRSSQTLNPSYGYFWWLNGQSKYMLPSTQTIFPGPLIQAAPSDMYAAMGASDQRLYIVPSKKMVVVRMGESSNPSQPNFALSGFDETLWTKINAVIK